MMKAKWKRFDDEIQELRLTDWIEANVYDPLACLYCNNSKDWGWVINRGIAKGRVKTEKLAKQAVERELVKLFRKLGKALDYDVE